jgi:integrase
MRLSTITATYVKRRKRFRVLIRPAGGRRISRTVNSEADAIALVRHFNRLGLAGVDLTQALGDAKVTQAARAAGSEPIRKALPAFLDDMVRIGEIRRSTAKGYRNRLAVWAYPAIGDVAWTELTREQIGAVLIKLRAAGRSLACLEQIRCPLMRFYQWQINARGYKGPNPAGDLKFFLGRQPSQRSRKRDLQWFRQDEARRLLTACRALKPRLFAFLLVSFGGGLRWGETTALLRSDIDWRRGRLHVQRTWSESGGRVERCKDGEDRWVTLPASAIAALRAHCEAMELEASLKQWTPAQRQLVFPNTAGGVTRYGAFHELVWRPLFRATGLPYRTPHAMRHTYATWLLEAGTDIRWVRDQMGHASIGETEGTYGHLVHERHERDVDHLDAVLEAAARAYDGCGTLESDDSERPAASPGVPPATARSLSVDQRGGESVVEGKGFEPSTSALRTPRSPN